MLRAQSRLSGLSGPDIEDLKKIVLMLQAQNEAMSNALASREHNYRMSGTKQLKAKFKVIEDYLSQDIMNTKRPDKIIFNDDTFYVPVRNADGKAKRIDGTTRREIYAMKTDELTQNQLEWRRNQNNERMKHEREGRERTLLRKVHKKMIEEKNMPIQDATMVLKKLMAQ